MWAQQAEVIFTTSEQLGDEVFVEEPLWKSEDNGTMIVHQLWKGAGVQECVNGKEMSSAARRSQPI